MASTLIILGHDSTNTLQWTQAWVVRTSGVVKASCSPGCQQTRPLTTGRGLTTNNYGEPVLAFTDDPATKPAELYVIQFADDKKALGFISQAPNLTTTHDRTILLVDPTPGNPPDLPYTLVVIGWDPTRRLNLDTSKQAVVVACKDCQQTQVVVVGVDAAGAPSLTLSKSVAIKPAETYVLGFNSEADALTYARSNLLTDEQQRRTVLLIVPPPAAP